MPTGGPWRRPAHAGHLPTWERLAIALVLLLFALGDIALVAATRADQQSVPHAASPVAGTQPAHRSAPGERTVVTSGSRASVILPSQPKSSPSLAPPSPDVLSGREHAAGCGVCVQSQSPPARQLRRA